RNRLCRLKILDRRRLGLDLNLRRSFPRLLPHWRHWRGAAAQRRLMLRQILIRCKRTDNRHTQAVPQPPVYCGAEKDLCFLVYVAAELFHHNFDFGQGETWPACHLNENPRSVRQGATPVYQRTLERLRERIVRPIV